MTPVVKWAGGKRQLLPYLELPKNYNTYYEPFIGGGALFCSIAPKRAVINDLNAQLMNVYTQIKKRPEAVLSALSVLQDIYNSIEDKDAFYYHVRDMYNQQIEDQTPEAAALLVFLNKAGYNGLYRVNASGKFNVPPAHRKTLNAYDRDNIMALSVALKNTKILCGDFEVACRGIKPGDFVFFDSPYYDVFDSYQAGGFDDHERLCNLFKKLTDRGVYCILTNNDCDYIRKLYKDYTIVAVDVKRMINSDSKNRKGKEVIIYGNTGGNG